MSRFDFLKYKHQSLYEKCIQAEQSNDISVQMLKIRQVLEYIVHELGGKNDNLLVDIGYLNDKDILNEQTSKLFHTVRQVTNKGVHGKYVTPVEAMSAINNLVEIMVWYAVQYKRESFNLNDFSSTDTMIARRYLNLKADPSNQNVRTSVSVDPLAIVGSFSNNDVSDDPLVKDVFETNEEYAARISQMKPIHIGYGILDTRSDDGYNNVRFLQHHLDKSKTIQFAQTDVYFFVNYTGKEIVIDGDIVAKLRVYNNKVYCDYSCIYLRNGEQDLPIQFICWRKMGYETDSDYRKRVEALPVLPLGLCMPIRSRYDIEKQQLPFETKKFAYVPFAIPSIYTIPCDRDMAKRACMQREPFAVFGNITLNGTMERVIIRGKEIGIVYDNEQELKEQREREEWKAREERERKEREEREDEVQELNSIGLRYYNEKNYTEAVKYFRKAAKQGFVVAQNWLGYCYDRGLGVQQDFQEAVKWYREAVSQGLADAQNNLGCCYYKGHGVKQDHQEAANLFRKAAAQGHKAAQGNLKKLFGRQQAQKKSSCFITTATCLAYGKDDDCYELMMFRQFRDGWLAGEADGKALIDEYYRIAPQIVERIDRLTDAKAVYHAVWEEYLKPCLTMLESGRMAECKALYMKMVRDLQKKHLDS